jgi:hypothetical protein
MYVIRTSLYTLGRKKNTISTIPKKQQTNYLHRPNGVKVRTEMHSGSEWYRPQQRGGSRLDEEVVT